MKKEELIKKYMNNELCIKRNGASDEDCENISYILEDKYNDWRNPEYEWLKSFSDKEYPQGIQLITVQEFLKAREETDKEEDYSHLIGKEVEVRDSNDEPWSCKLFRGAIKDKNGNTVFFVDPYFDEYGLIKYEQMREIKQETIHLEKGDYTKEELETELNKFKNK